MNGSNIVITSSNGKPVDVTFAGTPDNNTTVGEFISLKNLLLKNLLKINGSEQQEGFLLLMILKRFQVKK